MLVFPAPGILTFDLGLNKSFKLREKVTMQFRAEAFNLFNRANFGLPARNAFVAARPVISPDPTVGLITNTNTTSRQIQFALKILF